MCFKEQRYNFEKIILEHNLNDVKLNNDSKSYLNIELKNLKNTLKKYEVLIKTGLNNSSDKLSDIILIDYGGGLGLMSQFGKYVGFKKVIYIDNNKYYLEDAKKLSNITKIKADYYYLGEIEKIDNFINSNETFLLISNNVIEHIYNLEKFLLNVFPLNKKNNGIIIMSTSANPFNRITRDKIQKYQMKVELKGLENSTRIRKIDINKPFIEIRKGIIEEHFQNIGYNYTIEELNILSELTKGLIKSDIIDCIDNYRNENYIKNQNIIYSNTCEPNTGNWAERLIDFSYIKKLSKIIGVELILKPGKYFYNRINTLKKIRNVTLNIFISLFPKKGLKISSFILIILKRN